MKSVVLITVAAIAGVSYAAPKVIDAVNDIPFWKLLLLKRQFSEQAPAVAPADRQPIYKDGSAPQELHHDQDWLGKPTSPEKDEK